MLDLEKLGKILALAESPNDHEALAALRKAAQMARSGGKTLGEVIGKKKAGAGRFSRDQFNQAYAAGHAAGHTAGMAAGQTKGDAAGAAPDLDSISRTAFQKGYDEGVAQSSTAVRLAYARGLADGKNGVDMRARPKGASKRKA
ncbi:hypothetical protein WCLP8_1990002 [uncultured Gammaproteobacteria bacterium]